MARHPDQPLIKDSEGVLRFKENKIVKYLVNDVWSHSDLPHVSLLEFSVEDRAQLMQLTGYSLDGWADLPYISNEDYLRVANQSQPYSEDLTMATDQPELKAYKVCVHDLADYTLCELIKGVYSWAIEEGRLTFRDGNGEYLAIFHQWLYFMLDDGAEDPSNE